MLKTSTTFVVFISLAVILLVLIPFAMIILERDFVKNYNSGEKAYITIQSSGTVTNHQTVQFQPQSETSPSLFSAIKDVTSLVFEGISAVTGVIAIIEARRKSKNKL